RNSRSPSRSHHARRRSRLLLSKRGRADHSQSITAYGEHFRASTKVLPPRGHRTLRHAVRPALDLLHVQPRLSLRLLILFELEYLWPCLECPARESCRLGGR